MERSNVRNKLAITFTRTSMKPIVGALLVAAVLTSLALFSVSRHDVPVVRAGGGCTNAALQGRYALTWSGFTNPTADAPGNQAPWAGTGTVTFDGEGNLSAYWNGSTNGGVYTDQSSTGTYSVNSGCDGSMLFTTGDGAGFAGSLVLIGDGKEVFGNSTGTGDTMTFDLKK